jgi:hypothetical protein
MEEKQIGDLIEELKALKLRESVVISQLEAANRRRSTHDTTATAEQEIGLSPGDRVYVVNRVRKPATWTSKVEWIAEKERRATVTRVTANQVHILTDNGVRTWRAPNNLRKLTK